MLPSPFSHATISLYPVFHARLEFAAVVRAALLEAAARGEPPDVVAVELPGTWKEQVNQAVNRLPYLSLVLDESGERHLFLPVEPTDALIEALRTAKELGIPTELIDLDLDDYPFMRDPAPDPYPVHRLGYEPVMRAVLAEANFPRTPQDEQRETMMAHALQRLAADQAGNPKRVFCVLGVAHVQGVLARLESPQPRPLARAKPRQLKLHNWSEKSSREFMTEAPFLAAAYERARKAPHPAPSALPLSANGEGPVPAVTLPASGEGWGWGRPSSSLGQKSEGREKSPPLHRERGPGGEVPAPSPLEGKSLGRGQFASPLEGEGQGGGAVSLPVHGEGGPQGRVGFIDREAESECLLREAVKPYADEIGGGIRDADTALLNVGRAVTPRQFRLLGNFARKYARIENQLVPDLYQLVVAARGCVDDGYARQVWELGTAYPWQDGSGMLPTLDLDEAFATVGGRRLTLRRTIRRVRPRLRGISDTRRAREKYPGQWKTKWSGRVICSHVPEDLLIEDFGRYLQHKAKGLLSAERSRTEPFTASMKDGLDLRETLRNYHEGRLFVRENGKITGKVGSVVVIFDEERPKRPAEPLVVTKAGEEGAAESGERFPWLVTWLGEHEQESDMALYATPAGEQVIGPGISRCEYGGFVMSYPPQRMLDVWSDRVFDVARTKAERLLLAALDYSEERYVAYIAEKPPRPWLHSLAARLGRQIVYVPLGQIPRRTLNRIHTFHVLEGQSVREYAKEYIPV